MTRNEKIAYCVKHNIFSKFLQGNSIPATAEEINAVVKEDELDEAISKNSKAESLGAH